ncbi:MAG: trehalose-phosphatase [Dehalococcoidia bacterium]
MLDLAKVDRFRTLATARGPLLIATDLDGTLAPIAQRPGDARVPTSALAVLDRLTQRVTVAVITGRDLNTARRLVPCEGAVVVGSHGLEATFTDGLLPLVDRSALGLALERVEQQVLTRVPSALVGVERKAISTAFHYRDAPELEGRLREALGDLPDTLRLRDGRRVLEVLPNEDGGKDRALAALVNHFKPRAILVMGDDRTDAVMFEEARGQRERGLHVLVAGVSGGDETPPEIIELSDVMLQSTDEAIEALETVARALGV